MLGSKKSTFFAVLFVAAVILFSNIGDIPLLDPDEPVYAETPKEMLLYEEFISPRIYGDYWYDKPPMYYWLVAASYKLFGIHAFAARFPSVLMSLACIGVIFSAAGRMFSWRAGLISALVLTTSIEFFYLGKAAVTDMTLALFITGALLSFINKKYWGFYILMGLAVLTKGPIGLFFPVVIVFLYLLFTRNLQELKRIKLCSGTLLFALIAGPWYAIMYQLHGTAFIDTFLGFHNVTRFTSPEHPSGTLWYYYIPVLLVGFFPWIAVLFQSSFHALRHPRGKFNELLFLHIWAVVVFVFFTVSQTKLVSYILPMYPALAMIVGWYIDRIWSEKLHRVKRQYIWGGFVSLLLLLFGISGYLGISEMPAIASSVYALIAVFTALLIGTVFFLWKKKIALAFSVNVVGMTAMALVISYSLFPAAAPYFSSERTASEFQMLYDGKSPIYVSKFLRPGFAFYGGQYGQELYFSEDTVPDIEKLLVLHEQAYFVVRVMDYDRIPEQTRQKLHVAKNVDNKMILTKRK